MKNNSHNSIRIEVILGKAGTGKTNYAVKLANYYNKIGKKIFCLSYTHAALENMRKRNFPDNVKFKTINSFFRIDMNKNVLGPSNKNFSDIIIIDEFSLIDSDLFDSALWSLLNINFLNNVEYKIYLLGDILQLGPPLKDKVEQISFSRLEQFLRKIDFNNLSSGELLNILKHLNKLPINSELVKSCTVKTKLLNKNFRSGENVMNMVEQIIFLDQKELIKNYLINLDTVLRYISTGSVYIASSYKKLREINSLIQTSVNKYRINGEYFYYDNWFYRKNEIIYSTVNYEYIDGKIYNGEQFILLDINSEDGKFTLQRKDNLDEIINLFPDAIPKDDISMFSTIFLPGYLYTFHKAQGSEFRSAVICIDDLFEFSMLYTGITRAREECFFHSSQNEKSVIDNLVNGNKEMNLLCKYYNYLDEK